MIKLHKWLAGTASAMLLMGGIASAEDLTIGLSSEPSAIDPHYHNLGPNNMIAYHMFDRLIHQNEKQQLQPGLATSWKPINATTWELKLREGVVFHDGNPFNADDVVFSFERAPNVPNSPSSFATYTKGKTVKKIDDYTVHITTEKPYPLVPNDISTVSIISVEAGTDATTEMYNSGKATVGSGPYKYAEYVPGDRIVLEANPDYWGAKPKWDKVTFKPIKSGPSRVAALLAGDVDLINGVPTTDIEVLSSNDKVSLWQGPSNRVIYLHLDHDRDDSPFVKAMGGGAIKNPLKDQRVREAISKAISRDLIVERVMEGVAVKAGQLLPDGFFGVSENLKPVEYDAKGAKELLAAAGVGDGFELRIHGPNDRYINDAKIVEAIAQMLNRVGIKTDVETMPRSVYFKRASRGGPNNTPEFSMVLVGWGAGSGEASSPLRSLIHTYDKSQGFGSSNRGRYSNAEVDAMIEEALATVDDEKRQDLLAKATEIAINDQAIIPLHYQVNTWATRKGLEYLPRTDEYTLSWGVSAE
ncbi:ABC transporter substrate-binding protein [Pseudovibrio ascidiaceicola]|uniref:ABC transporter substrate-binding protein n=1 Tax=Pseudovibrio TaxID=258255 RepID=UPI0007AE87BA|nr:ABC transporter substrate-binding protein [Pseudovibrio sp. Ad37]KZL28647.1 Heme-binding protein A precursor [Pseudovibrio sp. Ad37]